MAKTTTKTATRPAARPAARPATRPEPEPAKGRAVAKMQDSVPEHLRGYNSTGAGTSSAQEDNLVPLIYILQPLSPQALPKNPAYMEGAEAGMIWMRGAVDPLVSGDDGILFQPCHWYKEWVEWIPRKKGGGFVGRHQTLPPEAEKRVDEDNPNKIRYVLPNGNEVIETRYHVGCVVGIFNGNDEVISVDPMPFVIPFTGTGHTVSRGWMFLMNGRRVNNQKADTWLGLYRLKLRHRSNAEGEWFAYEITWHDWVPNAEDVERGATLHEAFSSGEKQAEVPEVVADEDEGDENRAGI